MATPKILAFAGSTRTGSFNKKLVKIAVEGARAAGAGSGLRVFRRWCGRRRVPDRRTGRRRRR